MKYFAEIYITLTVKKDFLNLVLPKSMLHGSKLNSKLMDLCNQVLTFFQKTNVLSQFRKRCNIVSKVLPQKEQKGFWLN